MNVFKRFWKLWRQDKRSAPKILVRLKLALLVDKLERGVFTPDLES